MAKAAPIPLVAPVTTELEGTWKATCFNKWGQYNTETTVYTGNTWETTTIKYDISDTTCAGPSTIDIWKGTFTIGDTITTTDTSESAKKINHSIPSMGETSYNIFQISGSNLYYADDGVWDEPSRPTTLDKNVPYVKQ